jgi:hypothetical protein
MAAAWRGLAGASLAVLMSGQAWADDFEFPDFDELPPIKTTGALTYTFQETKQPAGVSTMQHVSTATINPSTYIYEPWLATVNSSLSVSNVTSADQSSGTLTGSFQLDVLPQSDYPTSVSYTRFDRSVQSLDLDNQLTGQNGQLTTRVNLPWDVALQARVQADEAADDKGLGQTAKEATFDFSKLWDGDQVRLGLAHRDAQYTDTGGKAGGSSVADSATARYRSQPFEGVTTDSVSTARVATVSDQSSTETSSVMQGVTTAIWRPKELGDVTINGALRTFSETSETVRRNGGIENRDNKSAFGSLSSSYVFAPRLTGSVGLNLGVTDNLTKTVQGQSVTPGQSAVNGNANLTGISYDSSGNLSYTSEGADWEGFNWTWGTGDSIGVGGGSTANSNLSNTVNLNQNASKEMDLPLVDKVYLSLTEGTGFGLSTGHGLSLPLSHSVTLSKNTRDGKLWNVWHFSASDTRSFGGASIVYDLINAQATSGWDLDRFSSISINVGYQVSRQVVTDTDTGFVDNLSGQITYRERTVFGVENLNFSSDLQLNPPSIIAFQRAQDLARGPAKPQETSLGSQRWTNRFDYLIGQLRTSLTGRIIHDEQGIGELIMFQISRRF